MEGMCVGVGGAGGKGLASLLSEMITFSPCLSCHISRLFKLNF